MNKGTFSSHHLRVLNGIISELKAIKVKTDDKNQVLRLIWSLPSSYKRMKLILIHEKEKITLLNITNKLFSEKKRLRGRYNISSENSTIVSAENWKKKNSIKKKPVC